MRYSNAGIKPGILHRRKILTIGVDPMASFSSSKVMAYEQTADGILTNHTNASKYRAKNRRDVPLDVLRPTLPAADDMAGEANARLMDSGGGGCL